MSLVAIKLSWRDRAGCAPWNLPAWVSAADFFTFGENPTGGLTGAARDRVKAAHARAAAVCGSCSVSVDCAGYIDAQLPVDRFGVWAGHLFKEKSRRLEGAVADA